MPTVQPAYPTRLDAGIPYKPAMSRYESDTRVAEAAIKFGAPVKRGTNDMGCLTATAATILGFAMLDQGRPQVDGGYAAGVPIGFMSKGELFVTTAGAVADGDPVYYNTVTFLFTNAAGTNIIGPFVGWEFDITTAGAGLSIIAKR
jgi:hypothetical protein